MAIALVKPQFGPTSTQNLKFFICSPIFGYFGHDGCALAMADAVWAAAMLLGYSKCLWWSISHALGM